MATIRLYGNLKRFGDKFDLEISDVAEAIRALCYQLVGFRQSLQQGYYKVRIGKYTVDPQNLAKALIYKVKPSSILHITPVLKGAKRGGVFGAVLGVTLIAFSFWNPLGWATVGGAGIFSSAAQFPLILGGSLLLGGISQILTKPPTMGTQLDEKEKKQSTSFSNLENLVAQGRPVPLAYGEIMTGSLIISQGIETYNVEDMIKKSEGL